MKIKNKNSNEIIYNILHPKVVIVTLESEKQ